jgi:hypothetical protein
LCSGEGLQVGVDYPKNGYTALLYYIIILANQ